MQNELNPIQLEAKLIAQEHRLLHLGRNFRNRSKWSFDDPRRSAANRAMAYGVFRFFFLSFLSGGAVVSYLTLYLLLKQTNEMKIGNKLFADQNESLVIQNQNFSKQIRQQKEQFNRARKSELIDILFDQEKKLPSAVKYNALEEFLSISPEHKSWLQGVNLNNVWFRNENTDFSNFTLRDGDISEARFITNLNFNSADLYRTNFSHAFFTRDTFFSQANIDGTIFDQSQLHNAIFDNTSVMRSTFISTKIIKASFVNSYLHQVDFSKAEISQINFDGASLEQVTFTQSSDFLASALARAKSIKDSKLPRELIVKIQAINPNLFV